MSVAVVEHTAFVKVAGRANFTASVPFRSLILELNDRGVSLFILDLSGCTTMDSTFLGVLAGLALRQEDLKQLNGTPEEFAIELLNPSERITELLENLGVGHLFKVRQEEHPCTQIFETVAATSEISKLEQTRTCLEAHELLMKIDPRNVPKFKDVAQFMAEDVKRMTGS